MTNLYVLIGVAIVFVVIFFIKTKPDINQYKRATYHYKKKLTYMSFAEWEFFNVLTTAVDGEYLIFAQVHLPTIVDYKIKGQNWEGAFRHISQKSVDFVLCDKNDMSPKLALELDDKTHTLPERQDRDREVEIILKEAGLPLLRLNNQGHFDVLVLKQKIEDIFKTNANNK